MKKTRWSFMVTGRGDFPLDMLRYDCCWPSSSSDVALIDASGERSVRLRGVTAPTVGRWESFTWRVSAVEAE